MLRVLDISSCMSLEGIFITIPLVLGSSFLTWAFNHLALIIDTTSLSILWVEIEIDIHTSFVNLKRGLHLLRLDWRTLESTLMQHSDLQEVIFQISLLTRGSGSPYLWNQWTRCVLRALFLVFVRGPYYILFDYVSCDRWWSMHVWQELKIAIQVRHVLSWNSLLLWCISRSTTVVCFIELENRGFIVSLGQIRYCGESGGCLSTFSLSGHSNILACYT